MFFFHHHIDEEDTYFNYRKITNPTESGRCVAFNIRSRSRPAQCKRVHTDVEALPVGLALVQAREYQSAWTYITLRSGR